MRTNNRPAADFQKSGSLVADGRKTADMEQEYQNLARYCRELGVTLSEAQIGQFKEYYELLTEWNSFMNLTAITEL